MARTPTTEFELTAERWGWAITLIVCLPIGYAAWLLGSEQPVVAFLLGYSILVLVVVQAIRWYTLPEQRRPNRERAG